MGKYIIEITEQAKKDLKAHKTAGNKATNNKIKEILLELENTPLTGVGKPERLKYDLKGFWSRRINHKDRIVYTINCFSNWTLFR
jgi:toxin YoeB